MTYAANPVPFSGFWPQQFGLVRSPAGSSAPSSTWPPTASGLPRLSHRRRPPFGCGDFRLPQQVFETRFCGLIRIRLNSFQRYAGRSAAHLGIRLIEGRRLVWRPSNHRNSGLDCKRPNPPRSPAQFSDVSYYFGRECRTRLIDLVWRGGKTELNAQNLVFTPSVILEIHIFSG